MEKIKLTNSGVFAILVLPFVWTFEVSAIGPALGAFSATYPGTSVFQLQLIMIGPLFTSFIFSIVAGKLASFIDKKKIVITGLLLYGIAGILPAFAANIYLVIILRVLTGVGAGLVLPMPGAIIAGHFTGEKRERMMGLTSSVANVANVAASFIIGILLVFGYKFAFYSFAIVLVIAVIEIVLLPKSPAIKQVVQNNVSALKQVD